MERVEVEARAGPARCAFCREDVAAADDAVTCACRAVLHAACAREGGGRCPTPGCGGLPGALLPGPTVAPAKADAAKGQVEAAPAAPPLEALRDHLASGLLVGGALGLAFAVPAAAPLVAVAGVPLLLLRLAPGWPGSSLLVLGALLEALVLLSLDLRHLRMGPHGRVDLYLVAPVACAVMALLAAPLAALLGRRRAPRAPGAALPLLLALVVGVLGLVRWSGVRQLGLDLIAEARARGDAAAVEQLVYDLTEPETERRIAAERAVYRLDRAAANDLLLPLLRDPDKYVRHGAVRALGHNAAKEPRILLTLIEQLRSPEPLVVEAAAGALRSYVEGYPVESAAFGRELVARLDHPDPWARMNLVMVLGRLRDPAAAPALVDRLDDPSTGSRTIAPENRQDVASEAEKALLAIGAPALPALEAAARDHPRPAVRAAAQRVAERLRPR